MANLNQIRAYFSHLTTALGQAKGISIVAVAHMVPNALSFAPALNDLATLAAILIKPKSSNRPERAALEKSFTTLPLTREWANDSSLVVKELRRLKLDDQKLVILDIGGYFAESIDKIGAQFGGKLLGLMEGTENGVAKYEEYAKHHGRYKTPLMTVARSPLKLPEDYLVASSIVFSIEATLRNEAEILQTRCAAVVGYGRVGSAIAEILRNRGLSTVIHDESPIKLAEAAAKGFRACPRLEDALTCSSLVVCATGNKALDLRGFAQLRDNTVVASVTSADDEFELGSLKAGYHQTVVSERLTCYQENRSGHLGRKFFLVAGGNAANFLDGAVIGPAIQLIEGEKLAAVKAIIDGRIPKSEGVMEEVSFEDRTLVAEIWNEHFL